MRGLGRFQISQMKQRDSRIPQLFIHLRGALDLLEQITLHPYSIPEDRTEPDSRVIAHSVLPEPTESKKLAYTINEIRDLLSVSRSNIYKAIKDMNLRAVKQGHKTLILTKDLHTWINAWPSR
jgi:excisionase family DNA binding protein